jgi:uncharacterized membrane protein YjjB (DUF3815 family)
MNAFARQQWLCERASMLHYTHNACLVDLFNDAVSTSSCTASMAVSLMNEDIYRIWKEAIVT